MQSIEWDGFFKVIKGRHSITQTRYFKVTYKRQGYLTSAVRLQADRYFEEQYKDKVNQYYTMKEI